jgi:hypothetical protein
VKAMMEARNGASRNLNSGGGTRQGGSEDGAQKRVWRNA